MNPSRGIGAAGLWTFTATLLLVALSGGCIGTIGDAGDDGAGGPSGSSPNAPPGQVGPDDLAALAAKVKPGAPMMRILSNREYLNAVSDLIGERLPLDLQKAWTPTTQYSGFDAVPWTNFDAKAIRDRVGTLEAILDRAVASQKIMTCTVSSPEGVPYTACAKKILEPLATRAFARPLTAAETASLTKSYEGAVALATPILTDQSAIFKDGVRAAIGTIFLAPQFISRVESPPSPDFVGERDLTAYEVASRISFLFLGSIPDDALWAKAEDGTLLSDPAALSQQIDRFLSAKVDTFVQTFMGQWFDFRAYETAAEGSIQRAMWNETWRTLADVVKSDLPSTAIVSPGFTYLNQQMAAHYGFVDPLSPEFQKIPTRDRGGILQQASWLTSSATPLKTSPIHRGRLVQDRLLCKVIPPPDPSLLAQIQASIASIPATATVKERLEAHRKAGPVCFGCHQYMDPIGLGLEGFDQYGKVRTVYADTGKPVETDSNFLGKPFSTVNELNDALGAQPDYARCVSEKVALYSLRRVLDPADEDLLKYLSHPKDKAAPSVRETLVRLVTSNAFRKAFYGARN
jgi:hypothetical protein